MNLLNDCDEAGGSVIAGHEGKEEGGGQFGHNRSRYNNSNKNSLINASIQAISNLLSANIESSLMYIIGLGYHTDLQTRAAFMELLTKILQQSTEFGILGETVLADWFE